MLKVFQTVDASLLMPNSFVHEPGLQIMSYHAYLETLGSGLSCLFLVCVLIKLGEAVGNRIASN